MRENFDEAFEAIIEGARLTHLGTFLENRKIEVAGMRRIDEGMKVIDEECAEARDILIPFLQHDDPNVRVTAASALLVSRPELARPVLDDMQATCTTIAHRTVGVILSFLDTFGFPICGLCRPDPRYPIPEDLKYKGEPMPLD